MKHLRKFSTQEEYDNFLASKDVKGPFIVSSPDSLQYVKGVPQVQIPLWFNALEDMNISFSSDCQYSTNGKDWQDLAATIVVNISVGDRVYFRAVDLPTDTYKGAGTFSSTGRCNIGGNILSMEFGEDFTSHTSAVKDYYYSDMFREMPVVDASKLKLANLESHIRSPYSSLFYNCTQLKVAPLLKHIQIIGESVFESMFSGCTSLVVAPELPSKTTTNSCYSGMFFGCTNLEIVPLIAATTLSYTSITRMFEGCTKLRYIKAMFLDDPAECVDGYGGWVKGVSPKGVFVKNTNATWNTQGINGVPSGWTIQYADE